MTLQDLSCQIKTLKKVFLLIQSQLSLKTFNTGQFPNQVDQLGPFSIKKDIELFRVHLEIDL